MTELGAALQIEERRVVRAVVEFDRHVADHAVLVLRKLAASMLQRPHDLRQQQ